MEVIFCMILYSNVGLALKSLSIHGFYLGPKLGGCIHVTCAVLKIWTGSAKRRWCVSYAFTV